MERTAALDRVVEDKHARRGARTRATAEDRSMATFGTADPQAMIVQQLVDRRHDLAIGLQ